MKKYIAFILAFIILVTVPVFAFAEGEAAATAPVSDAVPAGTEITEDQPNAEDGTEPSDPQVVPEGEETDPEGGTVPEDGTVPADSTVPGEENPEEGTAPETESPEDAEPVEEIPETPRMLLKAAASPTSGSCGSGVSWNLSSGKLTISGKGSVNSYSSTSAPWYGQRSSITSIAVGDGITGLGSYAFSGLSSVTSVAFAGDMPSIASNTFSGVRSKVYYQHTGKWDQSKLKNYGGTLTWQMRCGDKDCSAVKVEKLAPTFITDGHGEGTKCSVCGQYIKTPDVITRKGDIDLSSIGRGQEVYVDGILYITDQNGHITLDKDSYDTVVKYTYNVDAPSDIHTQYPTGMQVWTLKYANDRYTATRQSALDNIMQYGGTSIRVTGKKGVRLITGIPSDKKKALISNSGYSGFTMIEDGTLLAKAISVTPWNPLVLGGTGVVSNYAYKKGKADPVFKTEKGLSKYTNAVVGFTLQQCVPDFSMRSYMKLKENSTGREITLYGGIVNRSIQYVANQNKNAFKEGTSAYDYIWSIINAKLPDTQTTTGKMIAHQGYKAAAPGNTIAAFELAARESDFWGIEADVRETKDGVLICSHEESADAYTNGTGKFEDLTYDYVKTLVVTSGNGIERFSNQSVPTLSDYLDICKKYGKVALLDLKWSSTRAVENAVQMVKDKGMQGKVIFQSSVVSYLNKIKSKYSDATMWYLPRDINATTIQVAIDAGCVGICADNITKDNVALAKSAGLKTCCWTATTTTQKNTYFGYGMDFILCNKPL